MFGRVTDTLQHVVIDWNLLPSLYISSSKLPWKIVLYILDMLSALKFLPTALSDSLLKFNKLKFCFVSDTKRFSTHYTFCHLTLA